MLRRDIQQLFVRLLAATTERALRAAGAASSESSKLPRQRLALLGRQPLQHLQAARRVRRLPARGIDSDQQGGRQDDQDSQRERGRSQRHQRLSGLHEMSDCTEAVAR